MRVAFSYMGCVKGCVYGDNQAMHMLTEFVFEAVGGSSVML